jgi:ribosomal-protein-alanine N-acetyltransferase
MISPPHTITTERLVLRRPTSTDAPARFGYTTDPEVAQYMDWPSPANLGDVARRIEAAASRWESGEEYSWAVTLQPNDRAVGGVACFVRGHAAELGFVLARECWGHGYAAEAAKAVLEWAAGLDAVFRIWATCDTENAASVRVLEKIGMSREGVLRRWAIRPNLDPEVPRDAFIYSWVR